VHFLRHKGVADEAVSALIGRMFTRLGEVFPTYGESVQQHLLGKALSPERQMPLDVFQTIVHGWYHQLMRDRSDATWPEYGGKRLARWYEKQNESVISFRLEMDYRNAVVYLPVFAAAVASGKAQFSDVFDDSVEAIFFLRQVRDFDSSWFSSIYQYCLLSNLMAMHKAVPVNG
jgi:hypothetical protein